MGISKLDHDLIVYKGIRGWDYEGGVAAAVKVVGGHGDAIEGMAGGALMDFGNYLTYYETAYSVPIITVTEPYQGESQIWFEKPANSDVGNLVAKDSANVVVSTFGAVSIAPLAVSRYCAGGGSIDNVNVSLGIVSYYNGVDYTVMPTLASPITTTEDPYGTYAFYYSPGYFIGTWFFDALDHWTDGDYYDPENPEDFDPDSEAGGGAGVPAGGAGGGGGNGIRSHHGMSVPGVPSFSAATTGMMSVYACSPAELQALANELWTRSGGTDWTDNLVKNYMSPFDNIIGMSLMPFEPTNYISSTSANIFVGNYDTNVSSSKLSNTFCQVDLGSVACPEAYMTFADYDNTKIDIYLPFIGIENLNTDDVMGATVGCVYNIDVLSGVCVAYLTTDKLGVFASFAGNCKADLPLSGVEFSSQSQAWAVHNFGQGGIVGSIARNNLKHRAMADSGTGGLFGIKGKMSKAEYEMRGEDTAAPQYKRSGSIGSAGALLGIKQPFLIFSTPRIWSGGIKENKGYVSNLKTQIGSLSGFLSCSVNNNQLSGFEATQEEKEEIKRLLATGIYI